MTRVLMAVDATEEAVHAAVVAHELFGDGAVYLAVNVAGIEVDLLPSPWWGAGWGVARPVPYGAVWAYRGDELATGGASAPDEATEGAARTARDVAEDAGLRDVEAIGELGDPVEAILRAADEHSADVIVVGSHHRSWLERLFQRSVTTQLVRHADVPVLVVR